MKQEEEDERRAYEKAKKEAEALAEETRRRDAEAAAKAEAEALAKTKGFLMINLDVRATQTRAIQSFEARGFSRYAVNEHYARVDDAYVTGYYFHKELK